MSGLTILFYFFMALAAGGAVAILFSKNIFKSALYLLVCLLSVAALYVLAFAEFLAVTQILIYAGGVLVVIIFGIMLTTKISGRPLIVKNAHMLGGGIAGIGLFIYLTRYLPFLQRPTEGLSPENINVIALAIFSDFSLPFEIAGVLLLVALIGAAVITSELKSRT
jgi:NADH:ubiquinone oxidoreductase subunit 6 (subunit J)